MSRSSNSLVSMMIKSKSNSLKQTLDTQGFVYIPEMLPEKSTQYVAQKLGHIIHLDNIPASQQLRPREHKKSTKNLYSGNYGMGEFPLHTDLAHWYLPPRYLLLRCIIPADNVCTFLISAKTALSGINNSVIHRALFSPRKKINGKKSLLKFYTNRSNCSFYRWDKLFIKPENAEAEIIKNRLAQFTENEAELQQYYNNRGDMIIVDNWCNFHGRSKVPSRSKNRLIERVYMSEVIF